MDQKLIFWTIVGMFLVTWIPRALPVLALASRKLPDSVIHWLSYVPASVLAALVAPELFLQDGQFCFSLHNIFLLSAVPCLVVGKLCGSFFGAVFTGIGCVALLRWFGM